jgi:hypothetical protein
MSDPNFKEEISLFLHVDMAEVLLVSQTFGTTKVAVSLGLVVRHCLWQTAG